MATIAIVPSDLASKRMLAERLARRLDEAGHRVVLALTTDEHRGPDDPAFEQQVVALRPRSDGAGPRRRPLARRRAIRAAAAAIDPEALGRMLDEVGADLVIVDIEEYEAVITVLADPRHRAAVLCSFFEVWPIAGLGPDDPGPAGGPLGRLRGSLAWWVMWTRLRLGDVRRQLAGSELDRIAVARVLARRAGVRRKLTSRQWLHPFVPRQQPMLVCNALELDVPHRPRDGVRHIGSLLEPVGTLDSIEDHDLVAAVAEAVTAGRPIVVCVFGALLAGEPAPLVDRIGDVARIRPDYEFVIGSSADADAAGLAGLANVRVAEWLPQRELLAVAAAAIVHSGNATLHECVAARVPMLVYPFRFNDQRRNVARVLRHGIGEVGDRDGDDAATIATRLDRVMNDTALRRGLERLAGPVERYERDGVAVAAVEELLASSGDHVTGARRTPP